jgi:hypothetical protein
MPLPDSDRTIDVLDAYVTAILEMNVDSIANAFVDDRGDADPAGLSERLQSRGDVDTIAIDVVVFDDDIAEVNADSEHDGRLARAWNRQRGAGALHCKRAIYSIDYAAELDDRAITDQLHDAAVVNDDGWVEDGLSVPFQSAQRARFVGFH